MAVSEAPLDGDEKWWHELTEDDPITLNPLKSLDVPPFELKSAGGNAGGAVRHFFDAVALASYITRRLVFENPFNRAEISREDCARLDGHIRQHLPRCRDFRVAELFDLQRSRAAHALRLKAARGDRRENEVQADRHGQLNQRASTNGDGGWAVVDDDLDMHEQAEVIAHRYATGLPDMDCAAEFPDLSFDATRAGEIATATAANMVGGFADVVSVAAEAAAREARELAAREAARKEAAQEARLHAEEARSAAIAAQLEQERRREQLLEEARAQRARREEQELAKMQAEWRAADRVTAEAAAAAEKQLEAEREAASLQLKEQQKDAELAAVAAAEAAEAEERAREQRKKEKEAEKKRKQKEKAKLKKEEERKEQAKRREQEELEAAKRQAALRCHTCDQGILDKKKMFEVMGHPFCSTSCIQKFRASSA